MYIYIYILNANIVSLISRFVTIPVLVYDFRPRNQLLEVDPTSAKCVDLAGIVADQSRGDVTGRVLTSTLSWQHTIKERPNSPGFVDDAEVPGLM